tara:strand:- start:229 stop:474 length:246 start_codon:yes stop_codon:yes gene_type:complete
MSVLTNINGIPLFSTLQEALNWASANGLVGHHTHVYNGRTGYMGGANHVSAINTTTTPSTRSTISTTRTTSTSSRSSNSYY